jgi:hypothetical protein
VKQLYPYIFLACITGGCASQPTAVPSAESAQNSESVNNSAANNGGVILSPTPAEVVLQPIVACDSYSKLDTNAQKKQLSETQQVLAKNKQDLMHRVKLACMYALPSSHAKEATKAHVLLQQLKDDDTLNDTDSAFINQLYLFNNENIKQLQKSRDDARTLETLSQKYETLEKKYDASEQKLLRLKNIEKKLNVR